MARKKAEPVYKGKYTASEMLDIDLPTLNKLQKSENRSELAKIVSRLTDVSKKRLNTLEKTGNLTPAYYGIKERANNNDLSVKGKDVDELMAMYKQQKSFLTAKTSTVKGAQKVLKAEEERLNVTFDDEDERKAFWEALNKQLEEDEGKLANHNWGSDVFQFVYAHLQENIQLSKDDITKVINYLLTDYDKPNITTNKAVGDMYSFLDDVEDEIFVDEHEKYLKSVSEDVQELINDLHTTRS